MTLILWASIKMYNLAKVIWPLDTLIHDTQMCFLSILSQMHGINIHLALLYSLYSSGKARFLKCCLRICAHSSTRASMRLDTDVRSEDLKCTQCSNSFQRCSVELRSGHKRLECFHNNLANIQYIITTTSFFLMKFRIHDTAWKWLAV